MALGEGSKSHEGLGNRNACAGHQLSDFVWAVQAAAANVQDGPPGAENGVHYRLNLLRLGSRTCQGRS